MTDRREGYRVVLISLTEEIATKIRNEFSSVPKGFPQFTLEEKSDADGVTFSNYDACFVIVGADHIAGRGSREIVRIISLAYTSKLVVAVLDGHRNLERQTEFTLQGADMVLVPGEIVQLPFLVWGWLRQVTALRHTKQPVGVSQRPQIELGKWSFDNTQRIVVGPDKTKVRLTETEWRFLWHLVDRDVRKVTVIGDASAAFEAIQRKDAIAYKIRAKLGAEFPLGRDGTKGYVLKTDAFL